MTTNPRLILLFAAAFAFFMLAPPFLGYPFPAYPLMDWADVVDVLTPLVLIPLYWLLFTDADRTNRPRWLDIVFLVCASLWTLGQGMHLSANSISNLLGSGTTPVHELVHFFDEVMSHALWHIAIIGLSILLLLPPRSRPEQGQAVSWPLVLVSAFLYGFTYFAVIIEGGTVSFGLLAALLIVFVLAVGARARIRSNDLTAFFFLGYVFALALFGLWYAYWGGFPEFSELGLL
jgi:hypothetical protein